MPELSRFYGLIIRLRYREHPPPHFHVKYQEFDASINMRTLEITEGWLPGRAEALALEWASEHRVELLAAWNEAQAGIEPNKIDPLP